MSGRHPRLVAWAFGCLVPLALAFSAQAEDGDVPVQYRDPGPFCGIYCLYGAMRYLEVPGDLNDLLRTAYVSSAEDGSSVAELCAAAKDHGLRAFAAQRLNSDGLSAWNRPAILHVKSRPRSNQYDHYWLYLGRAGNQAMIYDPPRPVSAMPYWQVEDRWDGTAILLSPVEINADTCFRSQRCRLVALAAVLLAAAACLVYRARPFTAKTGSPVRELLYIGLLTSAGVALWQSGRAAGLLPGGVAAVRQSDGGSLFGRLRRIGMDDLRKALSQPPGSIVLVDARGPTDYRAGHIPSAVNVPWNTATDKEKNELAALSGRLTVVVYCDNDRCAKASVLGEDLLYSGGVDVRILAGGWTEWTRVDQTKAASPTSGAAQHPGTQGEPGSQ